MTLALPEAWRQSAIARFDACPLSLRFDLEMPLRQLPGQMGHLGARGVLCHRAIAANLNHMRYHGERRMDVAMAMELLARVVAQREHCTGVGPHGALWEPLPPDEVVHLPTTELRWLRVLITRWSYTHEFSIERIVGVERRLYADIEVRGDNDTTYLRTITGTPDVLLAGPAADEATVLDWKAQPVDARVLTPTGWLRMGDLAVGDAVIGSDGRATEVVGVYPQGRKQVYEVGFTDGSRTQCCDEHLWTVRRSGGTWRTMTLGQIRATTWGPRWQVPVVAPVQFAEQDDELPLDPYLLGVLLGDGSLRGSTATLTTADPEITAAARQLVPAGVMVRERPDEGSYTYRLCAREGKANGGHPNPLTEALRGLGLMGKRSWEKHIPERYLYASTEERLALLQGLMDTDGSIGTRGQMSFGSASATLAAQVRFLVWSLGGSATLKVWKKHGPHRDAHTVYFRLPVVPFRLPRKARRWCPVRFDRHRGMKSFVPLGEKECRCIRVAAPDGLYVTDDFIVTHNSGWSGPSRRREPTEDDPEPTDTLSAMGYVQQVVYGVLVMLNYPAINRVTEREWYLMANKDHVREASVERWEMERILDVLAGTVSQMDAAVEGGPKSPRWFPVPGTHCGTCVGRRHCPIRTHFGIPDSLEEAQRLAREWHVAGEIRKERTPYLKGWVDEHGPVPIRHAKGRRVVGYANGSRSLSLFEPEDAQPPPSGHDVGLIEVAKEAGVLTDG